jgi:hypothetical protein
MSWSKDERSLSYIMSILTSLTIFAVSDNEGFSVLPLPRDRRLRISGRVATHVRALVSILPTFYTRLYGITKFLVQVFYTAGPRYIRSFYLLFCICAIENSPFFQEPIPYFIVILDLFIWEFIIYKPHFLVPISRI